MNCYRVSRWRQWQGHMICTRYVGKHMPARLQVPLFCQALIKKQDFSNEMKNWTLTRWATWSSGKPSSHHSIINRTRAGLKLTLLLSTHPSSRLSTPLSLTTTPSQQTETAKETWPLLLQVTVASQNFTQHQQVLMISEVRELRGVPQFWRFLTLHH